MTISDSVDLHDSVAYFGVIPGRNDEWWACQHPERPYDLDRTWIEERCRPCVLALGAAALQHPTWRVEDYYAQELISLPDAYERYRHDHDLPPLPERDPT